MHARRVALDELTAEDLARWDALAVAAVEPNPFFEAAFTLPAAEYLSEPDVSMLVVEDDEGWRACLPVQRTRIARFVPRLRTWRHVYCFLGTPLLDPGQVDEAAHMLLALALETEGQLALEALGDGGCASVALRRGAEELGLTTLDRTTHERALLERRPGGDYLAQMRSHRRRELNRLGRRLESELGGDLAVSDCTTEGSALDRFLELEHSGWKGRGETALESSPQHAQLFRTVCRSFAASGRLQLLALTVGDRTVAMKCNLYAGEGGFCFKIAYDEALGRFSPGVQLERENIRRFHEDRDERWQDSCADPQNEMINRLWPDRRRISTTVLARRGPRAIVSRQGIRAAHALRARDRRRASQRS